MNVEMMKPENVNAETLDVERRASRFAALADPARLRIVDALVLSDRSPGDLQAELGVSSSLLAHHLGILERAGLIERTRSEADRRRSYVRLRPGAFDGLTASPRREAKRVLFVCTANSARSQLAAELWRRASRVPVASAGTHPADAIEAGAIAAAERHGLRLRPRRPRGLDEVLDDGDWVVTVCDRAHEELGGGAAHWSVPDPVRIGTDAAFDAALEELARRIDGLAPALTAG